MKQYFHGENRKGPYFEGWYFKCQMKDGYSIALIPAMHIRKTGERSASIQVITADKSWYLEYPASSFTASEDVLDISVAGNYFSETGMRIDIEQMGISLHGNIVFGAFDCLKADIMGPFRMLGNMECAHSVVSMAHSVEGKLNLNDRILDFNEGVGYIEADRGRSFPAAYLWTQCTWDDGSLMLSVATIPIAKFRFTGCICAIKLNGREYRIATYRGAKIVNWSQKGAMIHQGRYRLEVILLEENAQLLRAPSAGDMKRVIHESVCAKVHYRLFQDEQIIMNRTSLAAGFEFSY